MSPRRERLLELAGIAVLIAVAALALAQSWQRWLDPIVDAGRDLYIPEAIRGGAALYRDIAYVYPPLTPYLLAAITFLTGSSLAVYAGIGIAIGVLTAAMLYLLVRRLAGWSAAFGATLLFVSCSLAGASTFGCNYVFPYSYAATLTMLFYLATIATLPRAGWAVPFAILAAWTKIDLIPALAVLLVYACIVHRMRWRWLAVFAVAAAAAIYVPYSSSLVSGQPAQYFYRRVSGLADLPQNLTAAVVGTLAIAAVVLVLRYSAIAAGILAGALALLIGYAFFSAWLILQLALIPFALRKPREPLLLLLIASLGATARIFFNPSPQWYGFTLVVPLYALIVYLGAKRVWLIPMAVIAAMTVYDQHEKWALKQDPVATSRGTFYDANRERAAALNAILPNLHGTLVVMPEGLQLNYFARAKTPIRFHTFTPPEIADAKIEGQIVRELEAHPPDNVVIVTRDVSEFGYRGFGIDYAREITAWLRARYVIAERNGPIVRLVKRNAAVSAAGGQASRLGVGGGGTPRAQPARTPAFR